MGWFPFASSDGCASTAYRGQGNAGPLYTAKLTRVASPSVLCYGAAMPKALMLAGGIVEPGAGAPGAVLAYVAVSGGPGGSRLFRVDGPANAPEVHELASETTIDLGRFNRDIERDLAAALLEVTQRGGMAALAAPSPSWICGQVRQFLKRTQGIDVD